MQELLNNRLAVLGVRNLGVILHSPDFSRRIFDDGHWRIWGTRCCHKTTRQNRHRIKVAHPHIELCGNIVVQQLRFSPCNSLHNGAAVFASATPRDFAAKLLGNQLSAITNTQDRNTEFVNLWIEHRRAFNMNAGWSTGEDDRDWFALEHLLRSYFVGHDL